MYSHKSFQTINKITHVKPKKRKSKVAISINVYFILFLCIFGLDFGFKKHLSKYLRIVFSCVQLCVSIVMFILLISRINTHFITSVFAIQYLTHCIRLLITKYNVYDLIIDVYSLDNGIMEAVKIKITFGLYFYTILSCGLKQSLCVVNCVRNQNFCENNFSSYWYCIPLIGLGCSYDHSNIILLLHIQICEVY